MADACECICSYQWAMRRLMQILNQAQTYCTEDDCQDPQGQVRFYNFILNITVTIIYSGRHSLIDSVHHILFATYSNTH